MKDTTEAAPALRTPNETASAGFPGPVADRSYRWMCRVIADDIEYESNFDVIRHAVHDEDRHRLSAATKDNPVRSWGGRCLYWREKRVQIEKPPVQLSIEDAA